MSQELEKLITQTAGAVARFEELSRERDAGYIAEGMTVEQSKRLDAIEAEIDALYPHLPQTLRDMWEN